MEVATNNESIGFILKIFHGYTKGFFSNIYGNCFVMVCMGYKIHDNFPY